MPCRNTTVHMAKGGQQLTFNNKRVQKQNNMRTIHSIRLPRKLKKDVINTCGYGDYYWIKNIMRLRYMNTGEFYTKIKKGNG